MQPVRNSHIIRHTLRHYLAAAIFAGIIIQLNCTIDSMVAGQFIGADAVSVIVLALPLGMLLPMLGGLAAAFLLSRKERGLHPVWLIPTGDRRHSFAVSVAYSRESVSQQFLLLCEGLEAMRLSEAENTAVTHCVEEMMLHQLEMGQSCGLRGSFDVGIVDGDDRFTILVKAAGKAFNPLHVYGKDDPDSLGLRIVEGFCRDVNYRYASGINCVYLNFDKNPVLSGSGSRCPCGQGPADR